MDSDRIISLHNTFKSSLALIKRLDGILRQIDLTHTLSQEEQELIRKLEEEKNRFWEKYRKARGDFDE